MNECGQVYVTVQASESMPMMMSAAGSGSSIAKGFVISWNRSGGVTGTYGFPDGMPPQETLSVQAIDSAISTRFNSFDEDTKWVYVDKWRPAGCIHFA